MCGRYFIERDGETFVRYFQRVLRHLADGHEVSVGRWVEEPWPPSRRHYNVTPTTWMPILVLREGKLATLSAHWWLLPRFAQNKVKWRFTADGERSFSWTGQPASHFNSRKDTLLRTDYWRNLLDTQRCLVPATGFVEWPDDALRDKTKPKIPHAFRLKDGGPLVFAGVFEIGQDPDGKTFPSFNIITVEPNAMLSGLPHHRMPAILSEEDAAPWLDPRLDWETAARLLHATPDEAMSMTPLGDGINSGRSEAAELLQARRDSATN
jgi:putative SOS response-associated peptidase YedK